MRGDEHFMKCESIHNSFNFS